MVWDGFVRLEGARIGAATGHAFDTPDEGLDTTTPSRVDWRSVTAGDWDGVLLRLEDPISPDARLEFVTAPMNFTVPLAPLESRPFVVEADDPARAVRIVCLPSGLPSPSCEGSFVDHAPEPGCNPYWLRVLQHDGAQAWSSPVFVDVAGPA